MQRSRRNVARSEGRKFSLEQYTYMQAKALYETRRAESRRHSDLMDEEGVRLGLSVPYVVLPDNHPMLAKAQELLDKENEARHFLYAAAHCLFDWATESTLAKHGTEEQKVAVRAMVVKVKKMAHVEGPFEALVEMSMKLEAK